MQNRTLKPTCSQKSALIPRNICSRRRVLTVARAAEGHADSITLIKAAAAKPGSVAPSQVLKACLELEKGKVLTENYYEHLSSHPWQLIWTADAKAVNGKGKGGGGFYFPLDAAQIFTPKTNEFENGVFLGGLVSITFRGPCITKGKQLSFDVYTMFIRLGGWTIPIPIKKEGKSLDQIDTKDLKSLPFFLYAYIDDTIVVGRGRSGGLALWRKADVAWLAKNGALTALKP